MRLLRATTLTGLLTAALGACTPASSGDGTNPDTGIGPGGAGGTGGTGGETGGSVGGNTGGSTGGNTGGTGGSLPADVGVPADEGTPPADRPVLPADVAVTVDGPVVAPDGPTLTPDAAPPTPDAAPPTPDAAPPTPDAAPPTPDLPVLPADATPPEPDAPPPAPDAAPPEPDAAPPEPDAAPPEPDAAPPEPGAAPPPVFACGISPVEDFFSAAIPIDADHWTLLGAVAGNASDVVGTCGGGGPEHVYGFEIPADGVWRFDTFGAETDYDTVLYLLRTCPSQADGQNVRCSDDVGSLASGFAVELHAGDVVYAVVDSFAAGGGMYRLNVGRLPAVGLREVCDASTEVNGCAGDTYCYALNTPGQPVAEEGICVPSVNVPIIHGVTAYRNDLQLQLAVDASDSEADATGQYFLELLQGQRPQVLDPQTGQTQAVLDFANPVLGQENFVGKSRLSGVFDAGAWPNTTAVRIRVLDAAGNVSDSTTAQVAPVPVRAAGQLCDLDIVANVCAAGLACLDPDAIGAGAPATCAAPHAPVLTRATGTRNVDTRAYAFELEGSDADRDVLGFAIIYIDAAGEVLDPPGQEVFSFAADELVWNGNNYTASARLHLGAVSDLLDFVAVGTYDSAGTLSEPLFINGNGGPAFGDPAVVNRGQTCDLYFQGRDRCSAGNLCYSPNYGTADGTCQAPVASCPADWNTADLTGYPVGAEWRVEGSLAEARNLTTASCAAMTAQEVYTFTAAQAGTYRFRTESDDAAADTALFVRSFCRYSDYGAELICQDDISAQNFLSDVAIDLAAEETVYVFVGGVVTATAPKGSWRGRYRLIAARR